MYSLDKPTRNYTLPLAFTGNDHVIYDGSFYYLNYPSESIVKYDLNTKLSTKKAIHKNRIVKNSGLGLLAPLYLPQQPDNYLDFVTDENGIWAVFGLAVDNNTVVMKFDPLDLNPQYMWNISLNHHQMADTFIVCGVLYGVDHVEQRDTRIRFALDLYKNKLLDVELPFSNPFKYTTSLGYNPRLNVRYISDFLSLIIGNVLCSTYTHRYVPTVVIKRESGDLSKPLLRRERPQYIYESSTHLYSPSPYRITLLLSAVVDP